MFTSDTDKIISKVNKSIVTDSQSNDELEELINFLIGESGQRDDSIIDKDSFDIKALFNSVVY